jgi:hypothetical protein
VQTLILPENQAGNLARFHHFLLGSFIPLIENENITWGDCSRAFLFPCYGSQSEHIASLSIPNITTVAAENLADVALQCKLPTRPTKQRDKPSPQRIIRILGRDVPRLYSAAVFEACTRKCRELWGAKHSAATDWAAKKFPQSNLRILFVQRVPAQCAPGNLPRKTTQSGSHRRFILNHGDLVSKTCDEFGDCLNISLDSLPLTHQAALFSTADLIIAQHGAALANLLWARKNSVFVEIFPDQLLGRKDYFGALARCLDIRHFRVRQQRQKGPVDTQHFITTLRDAVLSLANTES